MLLLASKSPRRRELLKMIDLPFELVSLDEVKEIYPPGLPAEKVPEFLSEIKAKAQISKIKEGDILITADTVVILQGSILGKPKDLKEAKNMLKRLSGKTHVVVTGVTLMSKEKTHTFSAMTEVTFKDLSDAEIDYYVDNYKPLDKAGAYGIQEWIGAAGVKEIKGSFYNVMGLPINRLYQELKPFLDRKC